MNAVAFTILKGGRAAAPACPTRAPNPQQPPPLSEAATGRLLGDFATMLLLVPLEAGATEAATSREMVLEQGAGYLATEKAIAMYQPRTSLGLEAKAEYALRAGTMTTPPNGLAA